ncbi:MAG: DUF3047 domain-containing protein [Deltaproteobacteria bacterium]|nr:DUF3047 domain-containing protein [Deltaproteobacteria bacterium]
MGKLPSSWRTWPFQRNKAARVYTVTKEKGNAFVHAVDEWDISTALSLNFHWDIDRYPRLSWRWRAKTLPKDAKESDDLKNDSACGVYIIIGKFEGHAIKYVWSTTLPSGKTVTRKEGKLKISVLDSGKSDVGTWQEHAVDVKKDYEKLFGEPLKKNPAGIAILTDGNATHSPAACDYDDFVISGR